MMQTFTMILPAEKRSEQVIFAKLQNRVGGIRQLNPRQNASQVTLVYGTRGDFVRGKRLNVEPKWSPGSLFKKIAAPIRRGKVIVRLKRVDTRLGH